MNKAILLIISILIIVFESCKQQEKIIRQKFQDKMAEEDLEKLIFKVSKEIKTVKLAKINFEININNNTYKSGGNIAILRDSVIVVSLIPLMGYEIARVFCFKDKILIIDRQDKTYYYMPYEGNIGKYYIQGNYNILESLLTGRAFIYEEIKDNKRLKKTMITEGDYIKYYFEMQENDIIKSKQEIIVREDNLLTENNEITDNKNKIKLNINYRQFKSADYFILPYEIEIQIDNANDKIDLVIQIGNIIINDEVNANVVIPEKYEEIILNY